MPQNCPSARGRKPVPTLSVQRERAADRQELNVSHATISRPVAASAISTHAGGIWYGGARIPKGSRGAYAAQARPVTDQLKSGPCVGGVCSVCSAGLEQACISARPSPVSVTTETDEPPPQVPLGATQPRRARFQRAIWTSLLGRVLPSASWRQVKRGAANAWGLAPRIGGSWGHPPILVMR